MNFDVDAYLEAILDRTKDNLLKDGEVSPKAIIITEVGAVLSDLSDLSDKEASKQIIRSVIDQYNGQMVILIYDSRVRTHLKSFPSIVTDRREALCVYAETKSDNVVMLQEYKISGSGSVIFGELSKARNQSCGVLTGFFNS